MSFSYNPALPSDLDWVRRLVGDVTDTTAAPAQLQDAEILAFLDEEPNKYYAAAAALGAMLAVWQRSGAGVIEKWVDNLRIKRDTGESAFAAVRAEIERLQKRGAQAMMPRNRIFRTLNEDPV